MLTGEYRVQIVNGSHAESRGDDYLPISYDILDENAICFTLNWGKVIASAFDSGADILYDGPPQFAVSAWFDPTPWNAGDQDDFFDANLVLNMVDYMPNASGTYATGTRISFPDCVGNYTDPLTGPSGNKRSVGGDDILGSTPAAPLAPVGFLDELNKRTSLSNKCPACD
jgi:hypothetical protein